MQTRFKEKIIKTLKLKRKEDRRLRRGHPWAFSNEFETPFTGIDPGEVVEVSDHSGKFVGIGYANPHSLIAVRLLTREHEETGPAFVSQRVELAKRLRDRIYPGRESCRVFFSESDLLPGLIVDRYGRHLCVQSLTAGVERLMPAIIDALVEAYAPAGIILRNDTGQRQLEGLPLEKKLVYGTYDGPVDVEIGGLRFSVDLMEGQKTGFFLDQVDNYRVLDTISEGADALDLFCHTGAWAMSAVRKGAASCTGIDSSAHALETASANARLNGLESRLDFAREDAFGALKRLGGEGRRYGLIISDPPAFIKSRSKVAEGLKGYRDLNTRVMRLVKPGGWLVSCSCSHHMDRETFLEVLRSAAAGADRTVRLLELRSQSKDHPVLLAAPETEYLKCALLQVV
jgi:23S rRNA (cytosine1962-C5)-methyltransferase